jgi:membrane protease YdiL (CAAX protease family)
MKKISKLWLFLIITFTINFSMVGIFLSLGYEYKDTEGVILGVLYMFVPMLAALFVEKVVHKQKAAKSLFISFKFNWWFLVAIIIPIVYAGLSIGISLMFPGVSFSMEMEGLFTRFEGLITPEEMERMQQALAASPIHPILLTLMQGIIGGITVNAVAAFGEELGWRGFLIKEYKDLHFAKASLIIGFIWGIWHAPMILMGHNDPNNPQVGVLMMTIWCILLSFPFSYIAIKAKSVIAAALMHGVINGTAGLSIMLVVGGTNLTVGVTGLAGFIALAMVALAIYIYDYKISKEKIMGQTLAQTLNKQN